LGRMAELSLAAVAAEEGRYASLLSVWHAPAGWLADQLVRLQAVPRGASPQSWTHM
jgi:hypothetical protein